MQEMDPILEERQERRQTFYARALGAISGVTAGIIMGAKLTRASLLNRLRNLLYQRDWFKDFNEADWSTRIISPEDGPKASPDEFVEKAYRDLVKKKPGLVGEAKNSLRAAKEALEKSRDSRLAEARSVFKNAREQAIAREKEAYRKTLKVMNPAEAEAKMIIYANELNARESTHPMFASASTKLERTEREIHNQFRQLLNRAREKHYDLPILNEMLKSGNTEAGHMNLGLRHADGKHNILIYSAVTAVSLGSLVYAGVRWLQHGDERKERKKTHLARLAAQRDTAAAVASAGTQVG